MKTMQEGESCGSDPFWVCGTGLSCKSNICRPDVVKVGGICLAKESQCEQGAVCAGTSTSKRCVMPMEENENCRSDPFWVCNTGLSCRNNTCRNNIGRKPLVKVGRSCLAEGSECEPGTVFVGTQTSKRCVKPLEEGVSCGNDVFGVCRKGLTCRNNACRKTVSGSGRVLFGRRV